MPEKIALKSELRNTAQRKLGSLCCMSNARHMNRHESWNSGVDDYGNFLIEAVLSKKWMINFLPTPLTVSEKIWM